MTKNVLWSWRGLLEGRFKRYVAKFVAKCPNGQLVKAEHQRPGGLTQIMDVPTLKYEDINMDFVVSLPWTRRQNDSIWLIVDWLKKSTHFIPVKSTYSAEEYGIDFKGTLDDHVQFIEFSYTNGYNSSISMASFEASIIWHGGISLGGLRLVTFQSLDPR